MSAIPLSLVTSGVMLGTGGPTGRLLGRVTGLSPVAVAGYRLAAGGALIRCSGSIIVATSNTTS